MSKSPAEHRSFFSSKGNWIFITLVLGLIYLGFANPINESVDMNRKGCEINHKLPLIDNALADTLKKITRADIAGVWNYRSIDTFHLGLGDGSHQKTAGIYITQSPTPLPLTRNDTMRISENGPFFYSIGALQKKAWGRARIEPCPMPYSNTGYELALYYEEGSTTNKFIRKFRIQHFSNDSLVIQEGNTYFRFSRRK